MKKILITGGTTFVSKYAASYFYEHGYEVFVLNRNTKKQVSGVTLIEGDRRNLGGKLKNVKNYMVMFLGIVLTKNILFNHGLLLVHNSKFHTYLRHYLVKNQ